MTDILETIREKSKKAQRTIVLPETHDHRTIGAINSILDSGLAKIIAIGAETVRSSIRSRNASKLTVIDPARYPRTGELVDSYYELRKHKGVTPEEASRIVFADRLVFAALLVRAGVADGFVAGADHTTADVVRTAIHCIQIDRAIGTVSGSFLMVVPECPYGESGIFLFADCGVNPDPGPEQLAGVAIASAQLFEQLVGAKPRVAFLSYSSKGSAKGPLVDRITEAVKRTRERAPAIAVDGELQGDSAIVPDVAKMKCPESDVAGKANVLIFPDLNSGNITYKLVQRLAKARAIGPLFMGTAKPCSDLSRGCTADDIVDAVAITSVRVR